MIKESHEKFVQGSSCPLPYRYLLTEFFPKSMVTAGGRHLEGGN
jgi:hypothetical protein